MQPFAGRQTGPFCLLPSERGGVMGPNAARLLQVVRKRAAWWLEGDLRASEQENARNQVGLAVMRGVWGLLESKAAVLTLCS